MRNCLGFRFIPFIYKYIETKNFKNISQLDSIRSMH